MPLTPGRGRFTRLRRDGLKVHDTAALAQRPHEPVPSRGQLSFWAWQRSQARRRTGSAGHRDSPVSIGFYKVQWWTLQPPTEDIKMEIRIKKKVRKEENIRSDTLETDRDDDDDEAIEPFRPIYSRD